MTLTKAYRLPAEGYVSALLNILMVIVSILAASSVMESAFQFGRWKSVAIVIGGSLLLIGEQIIRWRTGESRKSESYEPRMLRHLSIVAWTLMVIQLGGVNALYSSMQTRSYPLCILISASAYAIVARNVVSFVKNRQPRKSLMNTDSKPTRAQFQQSIKEMSTSKKILLLLGYTIDSSMCILVTTQYCFYNTSFINWNIWVATYLWLNAFIGWLSLFPILLITLGGKRLGQVAHSSR